MSAEAFLDTNILIHDLEGLDERKAAIAGELVRTGILTGSACISFQVISETLNVARRKAEVPLSAESAHAYLDAVLAPLYRAPATIDLYHRALEVESRYGYSFFDALIIAAALTEGCSRLYSEDLQDGQRIDGLTIVNPFAP